EGASEAGEAGAAGAWASAGAAIDAAAPATPARKRRRLLSKNTCSGVAADSGSSQLFFTLISMRPPGSRPLNESVGIMGLRDVRSKSRPGDSNPRVARVPRESNPPAALAPQQRIEVDTGAGQVRVNRKRAL